MSYQGIKLLPECLAQATPQAALYSISLISADVSTDFTGLLFSFERLQGGNGRRFGVKSEAIYCKIILHSSQKRDQGTGDAMSMAGLAAGSWYLFPCESSWVASWGSKEAANIHMQHCSIIEHHKHLVSYKMIRIMKNNMVHRRTEPICPGFDITIHYISFHFHMLSYDPTSIWFRRSSCRKSEETFSMSSCAACTARAAAVFINQESWRKLVACLTLPWCLGSKYIWKHLIYQHDGMRELQVMDQPSWSIFILLQNEVGSTNLMQDKTG